MEKIKEYLKEIISSSGLNLTEHNTWHFRMSKDYFLISFKEKKDFLKVKEKIKNDFKEIESKGARFPYQFYLKR